jgi:hypothetical protein
MITNNHSSLLEHNINITGLNLLSFYDDYFIITQYILEIRIVKSLKNS